MNLQNKSKKSVSPGQWHPRFRWSLKSVLLVCGLISLLILAIVKNFEGYFTNPDEAFPTIRFLLIFWTSFKVVTFIALVVTRNRDWGFVFWCLWVVGFALTLINVYVSVD